LTQGRQGKQNRWSLAGRIAVLFDAETAKQTELLETGRRDSSTV